MNTINYKSTKHIKYSNKYHIVWTTKYRVKFLNEKLQTELKEIFQSLKFQLNFEIKEYEIMLDHIHLLIECPPTVKISKIISILKSCSSRILRKKHKYLLNYPSLWTNSYFLSTVGGAPLKVLEQYIKNQKIVENNS